MKTNLETAKENYKFGTDFFSATGNLRQPLKVFIVQEAEHEDRKNEIGRIKQYCLDTYRAMHPSNPKDKFEKLKFAFQNDREFVKAVSEKIARMHYLESLEKDIINSEGGVIYCGETKTWSKIA